MKTIAFAAGRHDFAQRPAASRNFCRLLIPVLALLLISSASRLMAQVVSDNFNSGTDAGWSLYAPAAAPSITFPPVGRYRISGGPGAALAFKYRNDANFADFVTSVDLIDWTTANQAFGILSRGTIDAQPDGFVLNFIPAYGGGQQNQLQINRVNNLGPTTIAVATGVVLDPANKDYRMVFTGTGSSLKGELFEISPTNAPVLLNTITATDGAFAGGGVNGLFGFDRTDGSGTFDVTYDNFVSTVPEPSTIALLALGLGGLLFARRNRRR